MSRSYSINHQREIVEDIRREFPSRYRNATRLLALMEGMGDALQQAENLFYTYLVDTSLELATGEQLDYWGSLIGEKRGPFSDGVYRDLIRARGLINVGGNNIDDIIEIYRASTSALKVWYYDHPPAGFRVEALRAEWLSDARVGRTLEHMALATNAGVDYSLVEVLPDQFKLSDSDGFGSPLSRTLN